MQTPQQGPKTGLQAPGNLGALPVPHPGGRRSLRARLARVAYRYGWELAVLLALAGVLALGTWGMLR